MAPPLVSAFRKEWAARTHFIARTHLTYRELVIDGTDLRLALQLKGGGAPSAPADLSAGRGGRGEAFPSTPSPTVPTTTTNPEVHQCQATNVACNRRDTVVVVRAAGWHALSMTMQMARWPGRASIKQRNGHRQSAVDWRFDQVRLPNHRLRNRATSRTQDFSRRRRGMPF